MRIRGEYSFEELEKLYRLAKANVEAGIKVKIVFEPYAEMQAENTRLKTALEKLYKAARIYYTWATPNVDKVTSMLLDAIDEASSALKGGEK